MTGPGVFDNNYYYLGKTIQHTYRNTLPLYIYPHT